MDAIEELEHLKKRRAELKNIGLQLVAFVDWFAENEQTMQSTINTAGLCSALVEIDEAADYITDAIDELEQDKP